MSSYEDMFGFGITVEQELLLIEKLIDHNYNLEAIEEFLDEISEE